MENNAVLWAPQVAAEHLTEIQMPRLLALPNFLALHVQAGGVCLPHNLRAAAKQHMEGGDSQLQQAEWKLILDWCMVAAQKDAQGSSLLALEMEPVFTQDPEVKEWCTQ